MVDDVRVEELIQEVKELNRTLRGHNGTPGLLTQFALLGRDVQTIAQRIEQIDIHGCNFRTKEGEFISTNIEDRIEDRAPTFKWVREKLAVPIAVAVIIGLINAIVIAKYIAPLFH